MDIRVEVSGRPGTFVGDPGEQRWLLRRALQTAHERIPYDVDLRGRTFSVTLDFDGRKARAELHPEPWEGLPSQFIPRSMKVDGAWKPVEDIQLPFTAPDIPYYGD